jgi:hypothetical protein
MPGVQQNRTEHDDIYFSIILSQVAAWHAQA